MHDRLPNVSIAQRTLARESPVRLSYKFQRLREKIREAIDSGDLAGKLPGERELARRFNANAKTLSKALTDLAAEGLLDRSVGRGTYVRGSAPAPAAKERSLLLCDANTANSPLIRRLCALYPDTQIACDNPAGFRPSFISQFGAVIDVANVAADDFLRDLIVRGIPVVKVGHEPQDYSTHVVAVDRVMALSHLGRDLALRGHRRYAAVESQGSSLVANTLRTAAGRYARAVEVDPCFVEDVSLMVAHGVTAIVCDSPGSAARAADVLRRSGLNVPTDVSLAAIGCDDGMSDLCSGHYGNVAQKAEAIVNLLRDHPSRPTSIWLAPHAFDAGTIGDVDNSADPTYHQPVLAAV